jgi:DNA polymerase-3 subunit alpha
MGKKKKAEMDKQWDLFSTGMKDNGYSPDAAKAVWDVLLPFSAYGFNKSHTAGYGLVSYWTAYLKASYPAEYMAALLTSVGASKDKMAVYLAETRRMGVRVLPPDVNESRLRFAAVGEDIRFGLGAIRNVGENVVEAIIKARAGQGRYTGFHDFLRKVPLPVCNKRVVESLIKAGAFDSLGHPRKGLLAIHEQAVDAVITGKRNEAIGQDSLFGPGADDGGAAAESSLEAAIPEGEWPQQAALAFEREMLGLYVSSHPLNGAEALLGRSRDHSIADLHDGAGGPGSARIAGIITSVTRKVTKKGDVWALVGIEDHDAAIEVACFPSAYQLYAPILAPDAVVSVTGKIRKSEASDGSTTVSFSAEQMEILDVATAQNGGLPPVILSIREDRITPDVTAELKRILQAHPGKAPVHMSLTRPGRTGRMLLNLTSFSVEPGSSFMADVKSLLGPASVSL